MSRVWTLKTSPKKPKYRELKYKPKGTAQKDCNIRVEGWDTETKPSGECFVLANSKHYYPTNSLDDCLTPLTGRYGSYSRNFWWNMDFDVTAIFKHNLGVLENLTQNGEAVYKDWEIKYLPKKLLVVKKNRRYYYGYDAMAFYNSSLKQASIDHLDEEAHAFKERRGAVWNIAQSSPSGFDSVGRYCVDDADKTRRLAVKLVGDISRLGCKPKHYISPGNICQQFLLRYADVPTHEDIPRIINATAYEAYKPQWIDMWQRGSFDVWKYDIKSAYPATISKMLDHREGHWERELDDSEQSGFVLVELRFSGECLPMLASWTGTTNMYPVWDQTVRCWLTMEEYRYFKRYAKVEVVEAWTFKPNERCGRPWKDLVDNFFSYKEQSKDNPGLYLMAKQLVNSIYGKSWEKVQQDDGSWMAGRLFNPVAASEIMANTRLQCARAVQDHQSSVVMVSTDCIVTTKPLPLDTGTELGQWTVEAENHPAVFVRGGVYQLKGEEAHTRGFRLICSDHGKSCNCVTLWDALDTSSSQKEIKETRPLTSRQAVHWGRTDEANVWREHTYKVGTRDPRRLWYEEPEILRDLIYDQFDSRAWPSSVFDFQGSISFE